MQAGALTPSTETAPQPHARKTVMMTVFCDASFCDRTKAAGWGAWAIRDGWGGGRLLGGAFKRLMSNTGEAELCAIVNALWHLQANGAFERLDRLMLQSDSLDALGLISGHLEGISISDHPSAAPVQPFIRKSLSENQAEALLRLKSLQELAGTKLIVRHVRGHLSGKNRQCDSIARRHMRVMRDRLLVEKAKKEGNAKQRQSRKRRKRVGSCSPGEPKAASAT